MEVPSDVPSRLELLVRDYDRARSDAAALPSVLLTGMGVGVTVLAGVAAILTQACRPSDSLLDWLQLGSQSEDCFKISPYVLGMIPTLPVSLLSVMTLQGALATVRNRYVRILELAIREEAGVDALVPYGLAHLLHPLDRSNSVVRSHRVLNALQWLPSATISIFVGVGAVALVDSRPTQAVLVVVYGIMTVALIRGLLHGYIDISQTWRLARSALGRELDRSSESFPVSENWILIRNVAIPRPTELVVKAPIHLLAFVVASSSVTGEVPVLKVLLFTILLEFIVYQARYALNDLRDIGLDDRHPDRRRRLRLGPTRPAVRAGLMAISIRLVAFVLLVFVLLPPDLSVALFVVGVLSTVLAAGYEAAKRRLSTTSERSSLWSVLLLVGFGYAVRVGAGLHLGGVSNSVVLVGAVFGYLLGLQIVWMSWCLEGASFGSDRVVSAAKPHVAFLTRHALGPEWKLADWKVKVLKPRASWTGWRNFPFLFLAVVSVPLGLMMASAGGEAGGWVAGAVGLSAVGAGFFLLDRLVGGSVLAVGLAGLYFAVALFSALTGSSFVALFPLAVAALVQSVFREMTYDQVQLDFERGWRVGWHHIRRSRNRTTCWLIGDDAFSILRGRTCQSILDELDAQHSTEMARLCT